MSMYDNNDKDGLHYEIEEFLKNHTLIELLEIVFYFVKEALEE